MVKKFSRTLITILLSTSHSFGSDDQLENPTGFSVYSRGSGSFRGGRGGHKERPAEYGARKEPMKEEKLERTKIYNERTKSYSERTKIYSERTKIYNKRLDETVPSYMSQSDLEEAIIKIKAIEIKAGRKEPMKEEKLERTKSLEERMAEWSAREERMKEEKLERTKIYAECLGVTVKSYMSQSDLEKAIRENKEDYFKRKKKEKLESTRYDAKIIGVTVESYMSQSDLEEEIKKHKREKRERSHKEYLERRSRWATGPSGSYKIGSYADPSAAERILEDIETRSKAGMRISYHDSLRAQHAYSTLHPETRRRDYDSWD